MTPGLEAAGEAGQGARRHWRGQTGASGAARPGPERAGWRPGSGATWGQWRTARTTEDAWHISATWKHRKLEIYPARDLNLGGHLNKTFFALGRRDDSKVFNYTNF